MIRLMNSAMMPVEGTYTLRRLTAEEFAQAVQEAASSGTLRSYIGYPQTAEHIRALSGVEIPVSREATVVEDGDVLLICKLPYRVANPGAKGQDVAEEFEYFRCEYRA